MRLKINGVEYESIVEVQMRCQSYIDIWKIDGEQKIYMGEIHRCKFSNQDEYWVRRVYLIVINSTKPHKNLRSAIQELVYIITGE